VCIWFERFLAIVLGGINLGTRAFIDCKVFYFLIGVTSILNGLFLTVSLFLTYIFFRKI